jgi:protein KRI1
LKALKAKEIRERLDMIKKEGGKTVKEDGSYIIVSVRFQFAHMSAFAALEKLDLDGDWDPEAHDKQMADIYAGGDDDIEYDFEDYDIEKPAWDDDIDIADIAPPSPNLDASSKKSKNKKKKKNKDEVSEDDLGVDLSEMDADAEPSSSKKRKRTPTEEERAALAELDEMDFTSLAGGLPTRFKYTPVLPDNFGLSPVEILLADDAELNEFVGLKKLAPYRRGKDGKMKGGWDQGRGERLKELRRKLKERWGDIDGALGGVHGARGREGRVEDSERPAKKRKGKKERQKEKMTAAVLEEGGDEADGEQGDESRSKVRDEKMNEDEQGAGSSKKRRRKHKKASQVTAG